MGGKFYFGSLFQKHPKLFSYDQKHHIIYLFRFNFLL